MIYQRLAQGVMLLLLAGTTIVACESAAPSTPQSDFCSNMCKCSKCVGNDQSACTDDLLNFEDQARGAGCKTEYDTYLTCLKANAECIDGTYDTGACFNEETDVNTCIKPPPACTTVNDGTCDEPAPLGNGTCASGTDKADCAPPSCATAGDGVCDEPEGTGQCAEGSDPLDCPAQTCVRCLTFAFDTTQSLCETSGPIFSNFYTCACNTCATYCSNTGDLCDFGSLSATCENCLLDLCNTEYSACDLDG